MEQKMIKPPVEIRYREELEALKATELSKRPENGELAPQAGRTFILGSKSPVVYQGKEITIGKKYFGNEKKA